MTRLQGVPAEGRRQGIEPDQLATLELAVEAGSSMTAVARELGVANGVEQLRCEAVIVD